MRPARREKSLFWVLLGLALIVWTYNVYQVLAGVRASAAEEVIGETLPGLAAPPGLHPPDPDDVFIGEGRDPFAPPGSVQSSAVESGTTAVPEARSDVEPANASASGADNESLYSLSGIVDRTAILRAPDQTILIVSVGSAVADARVAHVGKDHVILNANGQQITLRLAQ